MTQKGSEPGTEWIFCREVEGQCPGLNPNSQVLERIQKTILINGKEVRGWMVKIVQEKGEGHVNLNLSSLSDE